MGVVVEGNVFWCQGFGFVDGFYDVGWGLQGQFEDEVVVDGFIVQFLCFFGYEVYIFKSLFVVDDFQNFWCEVLNIDVQVGEVEVVQGG